MPVFPGGRRVYRAAAAALALVSTLAIGASPAAAHPVSPWSLFDRSVATTTFIFNRTAADFNQQADNLADQGYLPVDIEIEKISAQGYASPLRMGGVFQRNYDSRPWRAKWGMTLATFEAEQLKAFEDEMRIVDIEVYQTSATGTVYYAAIWIADPEELNSRLAFNVDDAELAEFMGHERMTSRFINDLQEYSIPGCPVCYAAISSRYFTPIQWKAHWHLTSAQFTDLFEQYKDTYRMLSVRGVKHTNESQLRFAGIWLENVNGRNWQEIRNMNLATFNECRAVALAEGLRPVTYDAYYSPERAQIEYAMVWRQNN